ncbi:MAG: Flp pilus assembly complex ATPase component TadA [Thermoguttaceae bacterium]|nr:Flp pilus assembly complex ATPase component TadA [Thermoguttaceae bacterium]
MRQNILRRLFIALLVLGIFSWGESFLFVSETDFSFISTVSAQNPGDEAVDDAAADAGADDEEADDEEGDDEEGDEEGDEEAGAEEGAEGEAGENPDAMNPDPAIMPMMNPTPSGPVAPTDAEMKAAIEKLDHYGGYASFWKILAAIVVYLIWVRALDWISTDCIYYGFEIKKWVPITYGAFWAGMILFWLIPFFWVSYLFLVAGCVVPLVLYVKMHNQDLSSGEQVFTPEHIRFVAAHWLARVGIKIAAKAKDRHEIGFPAVLTTHGKDKEKTEPWRIQARAHDGFPNAREILSKLMLFQPEGLMLDFQANGVVARYMLDGVWNGTDGFTRELADPALQALKILCGMKPEDRRSKQEGAFEVDFEYDYTYPEDRLAVKQAEDKLKEIRETENKAQIRECERALERAKEAVRPAEKRHRKTVAHLTTQGTPNGERAVIMFEQGKTTYKSMEDLGMSTEMAAELKKQLGLPRGFILFAAPPAGGLRTTVKMAISKTDRYVREFYEIDDGIHEYEEIENLTKCPIHTKDMTEWRSELRSIFLKDPNVVVCRDIPSPEVMDDMLEEIDREDRLLVTTVRAKDAAEALLRIQATKCNAEKWAKQVKAVLCQRLIRKLCKHCKESYAPPIETLKAVGATEKIRLFRQPTPVQPKPGEEPPQPCPECHGLGYRGRTAIYELVIIGDETRKALLQTPKLELVRAALKKDGNQFMMKEGLKLVREGETSLQELKRALS